MEIKNAKHEFLGLVENLPKIACAIVYGPSLTHKLKVGHNCKDYHAFLRSLNFEYDADVGGQNLGGTVWFKDGTWASRGGYDGREWWKYNQAPDRPEELSKTTIKSLKTIMKKLLFFLCLISIAFTGCESTEFEKRDINPDHQILIDNMVGVDTMFVLPLEDNVIVFSEDTQYNFDRISRDGGEHTALLLVVLLFVVLAIGATLINSE